MSIYKCIRCNYQSKYFKDIKKHINIQKSCIKNIDCLDLTNDEMLVLTLIPYTDNKQNIDKNRLKNIDNIYNNKQKLMEDLLEISKNKVKICKYCNVSFNKIQDLKNHYILECFNNEICKKTNIEINSTNCNNTTNNIINITNINNVTVNVENPLPFDDNWDLSNISDDRRCRILYSKIMYTHLLEEILKNKINLNVIIDKDKDFGLVYKNSLEKYIKMEIKDIVKDSMDKLHKHLLEIIEYLNNIDTINTDISAYNKKVINNKYENYKNNKETHEKVDDCVSNIFNINKDDAIKLLKLNNSDKVINNINGF